MRFRQYDHIDAAPSPPTFRSCRIRDNGSCGAYIWNAGGRLERCTLCRNADGGVEVGEDGHPVLAACDLRDHASGRATGVHVEAGGDVTVGADCVFARNAGGTW